MARTFKKTPVNERFKKPKQDKFRKQSLKRSLDFDFVNEEND